MYFEAPTCSIPQPKGYSGAHLGDRNLWRPHLLERRLLEPDSIHERDQEFRVVMCGREQTGSRIFGGGIPCDRLVRLQLAYGQLVCEDGAPPESAVLHFEGHENLLLREFLK